MKKLLVFMGIGVGWGSYVVRSAENVPKLEELATRTILRGAVPYDASYEVYAQLLDERKELNERLINTIWFCHVVEPDEAVRQAVKLIERGADVNYYSNKLKASALSAAIDAQSGFGTECGVAIANMLVDRGARADLPIDNRGGTVMSLLRYRRRNEGLEVLYQRLVGLGY